MRRGAGSPVWPDGLRPEHARLQGIDCTAHLSEAGGAAEAEAERDYISAVCQMRNAADQLYWCWAHGQLRVGSTRAFIERMRNKLQVLEFALGSVEPQSRGGIDRATVVDEAALSGVLLDAPHELHNAELYHNVKHAPAGSVEALRSPKVPTWR